MTQPAYASVFFDCDSTLSSIEGIQSLCAALPEARRREVEDLTRAAMDGTVPLADVYARRLDLVRPSRDDLTRVGEHYVDTLQPGAAAVASRLLDAGVTVGIVSGGLAPAVEHLARHLGLADDAVHAVPVVFDADGAYVDFDRTSTLWRNHGKVEILRRLRTARPPLLFVGDGVTDLEAQPVVDLFVGYGGVVRRDAVQAAAERYVADPDLHFVLDLVWP